MSLPPLYSDPTEPVAVPQAALDALRIALDRAQVPGVVRYVVLRASACAGGGRARQSVEAIVDTGGNLVVLSVADRWGRIDGVQMASETAIAAIDAHVAAQAGLNPGACVPLREIVLDADGGGEVRVAHQLLLTDDDIDGAERHPALHDARFHLHHRAPDIDALRDRLQRARMTWRQRCARRLSELLRRD